MKSSDLLLAIVVFGAAMFGARYFKQAQAASTSTNAGGPYAGGSYFTEEAQREWAVPDQQLQDNMGWANL